MVSPVLGQCQSINCRLRGSRRPCTRSFLSAEAIASLDLQSLLRSYQAQALFLPLLIMQVVLGVPQRELSWPRCELSLNGTDICPSLCSKLSHDTPHWLHRVATTCLTGEADLALTFAGDSHDWCRRAWTAPGHFIPWVRP